MEDAYLIHHGIKGQRWGIRRFQNDDGTLTDAGKKRYSTGEITSRKDLKRYGTKEQKIQQKQIEKEQKKWDKKHENIEQEAVDKGYEYFENSIGNIQKKWERQGYDMEEMASMAMDLLSSYQNQAYNEIVSTRPKNLWDK